jgi:hypothetical protein
MPESQLREGGTRGEGQERTKSSGFRLALCLISLQRSHKFSSNIVCLLTGWKTAFSCSLILSAVMDNAVLLAAAKCLLHGIIRNSLSIHGNEKRGEKKFNLKS